MTQRPYDELLVDLAKLFRKHGPEPFEALARAVSDPEFARRLAHLLSQVAQSGRELMKSEHTQGRRDLRSVREMLDAVKATDPQKHELLAAFQDGFLAGTLLPTLRDVRDFIAKWGVGHFRADSRQKALGPLLRAFASMPTEQLADKVRSIVQARADDRELAGWSRLILDRDRGPKR